MVDPTLVVVLVVIALRMLLVVSPPPPRPVEPTLAVSTQSLDNDIAHSRLSGVAVCQPREAGAWHRSPIATAGSDF